MSKTKICLRCSRPKSSNDGGLCRVCEYEKGINQEKRQRSQNYKKYGIRETDSERVLRVREEEKEQKKKEKAESRKKIKLEQEKINNEKITGYYETNSQRKSRESVQKAEMVSNFRETGLRETNLERERREYHERDKNFRLYGREALDSEL